mmetsp:Transcript_683/g.640  ORF Transcript_683/g.640 Transcript_683/m.640 type:complete len:102 (+) Transcript_683:313-618(+)
MFLLATGVFPYDEEEKSQTSNRKTYYQLLKDDPDQFFERHKDENQLWFSPNFRELFIKMTLMNPNERITIKEVKKSHWFNEKIFDKKELKEKMASIPKFNV